MKRSCRNILTDLRSAVQRDLHLYSKINIKGINYPPRTAGQIPCGSSDIIMVPSNHECDFLGSMITKAQSNDNRSTYDNSSTYGLHLFPVQREIISIRQVSHDSIILPTAAAP